MEYQWISLSGKVWAPRCPMHPLWWSSHPDSTEWQPAMWAKTHCDESQPASWATTRIFKGISEPHIWTYLGPQPCPLNLFFSASNCLLLCVCVCVCARTCMLQHPPFSSPRPLHLFVCQCGPPAAQLACREIRIVLPASAQPRRPPVTALRSAPRWLALSITIYLLLE